MKRTLLASTALCLGAGMAVAMDKGATHTMSDGMGMSHGMGMSDGMMMEAAPAVTLGGDGRMGVISDADDNLKFSSRIRIKVTAAKELDNGLSAGGEVRTDQDGTGGKAGLIYLSGPFGKLSMGDVASGAKAAVGHVASVGYVNQNDPNEITYLRNTGDEDPTLQYMLPKLGPVQVYASVGMATTPVMENGKKVPDGFTSKITENPLTVNEENEIKGVEITQKYKMKKEISADTLSVGAKVDLAFADMGTAWIGGGYEAVTENDGDGQLVVGAGVKASGFSGTIVAGMQGRDSTDSDGNAIDPDKDGNAINRDRQQFAISGGYSAGQIGVTAFYTQSDFRNENGHRGENGHEATGFGFSWSLGGGAELKGGITNWPSQKKDVGDKQTADLGVTFKF